MVLPRKMTHRPVSRVNFSGSSNVSPGEDNAIPVKQNNIICVINLTIHRLLHLKS